MAPLTITVEIDPDRVGLADWDNHLGYLRLTFQGATAAEVAGHLAAMGAWCADFAAKLNSEPQVPA